MKKLVYGNEKRLFINTTLGCTARCSYCYLDSIGINKTLECFAAEEIIKIFERTDQFIAGKEGTIISIGCYSECMDKNNKEQTIKLIKYFIEKGNYIQMATKKVISYDDFKEIDNLLQFKNQLFIYISMPTISYSNTIERGTDNIEERVKNFKLIKLFKNIELVMYIKPVLQNITIRDLDKYIDIITEFNLKTVVGNYLSTSSNQVQTSDVGENLLYEQEYQDIEKICFKLKEIGQVFKHSTQVIDCLRIDK